MKPNQCEWCGRFFSYENMDSFTSFGCASYNPPEPFDPTCICGKCSHALYEKYKARFKSGTFIGDWQKSNAELKAAKECNLTWVGSFSKEINGIRYHNQWVPDHIINIQNQ
jgi:hypothetical protein